jgi:hypothetical protein
MKIRENPSHPNQHTKKPDRPSGAAKTRKCRINGLLFSLYAQAFYIKLGVF